MDTENKRSTGLASRSRRFGVAVAAGIISKALWALVVAVFGGEV